MSASIDAYRRAAWCALSDAGAIVGDGAVSRDEDGLARLVLKRGTEVRAVVEMMSGAICVRDTLMTAGWEVQIAHARKVRDVAPLACKTDKVDARVLAEHMHPPTEPLAQLAVRQRRHPQLGHHVTAAQRRASSRSSRPRHACPTLPRQAPAAFWPPDGPAWN
jgi:Transposase